MSGHKTDAVVNRVYDRRRVRRGRAVKLWSEARRVQSSHAAPRRPRSELGDPNRVAKRAEGIYLAVRSSTEHSSRRLCARPTLCSEHALSARARESVRRERTNATLRWFIYCA